MILRTASALALAAALFAACSPDPATDGAATASAEAAGAAADADSLVDFTEFELDNGLKVIFHVDRSDPVVAVALTAHVGSARELEGRTGFAHLFEHLLFLESENLGKGGLDAMSARIGGSGANGSTSRDRTNYFQTVPKDALEKMIWAEADKLGWFINTVTDPVLAKEKQVVKNEKRQSVDNRPYGHTNSVVDKNLYPEGHPYSWQVIGSLEDLDAATLDDVKTFYRRWYTPNNTTLVIAGDFDEAQARAWVEKYFAEIPRGEEVAPLPEQPATLVATKSLFHEDNFATLPQLTLVWPTVAQYTEDHNALNVLMDLLSDGKSAPFNEVLIDEDKLTSSVDMYDYASELAGAHYVEVTAFDGVDLDAVKASIDRAFARFEAEGVDPDDLARVKISQEVDFYNGVQSVLGKAFNLAQYEIFAGDPGYINQDIADIRAVTADDVLRVYTTYIKDKPYIATSFVPLGETDLALAGAVRAEVVEEQIVQGAEESFDASVAAEYVRTPSSFDRTDEPPYGETPVVAAPAVWRGELANGLRLFGIVDGELPLVRFELSIDGGHLLDDPDKPGVANLVAELLTKGTATKTTAELEDAIAALGAEIFVGAGDEAIQFSGQTLARNFSATMALLEEMIVAPRWDGDEFALAQAAVISGLQARKADPNALAADAFDLVTFGEDHIFSRPVPGVESAVAAVTLDDLKAFHAANLAPGAAAFRVVGDVDQAAVEAALAGLAESWTRRDVAFPAYAGATAPETSTVYFYDVPGAKQSVFYFGNPSLKATDDDFYKASVMNYILGGGGFASRLTQELRESKGYTYGIRSNFSGSRRVGEFRISSGVRSNVTFEAAELVKTMLEDYADTFTEDDLGVTKSFLIKSQARAFESLAAKLGVLEEISDYGRPADYVVRRGAVVEAMTVDDVRVLARNLIRPDAMSYVIVGDAATQLDRLEGLGFGAPVLVNDRLDAVSE